MTIPWIFGDEYLYLSKARNIARDIDVLADVSQGHTYPPLYSYLLSLVMGSEPLVSYQHVRWLNILVSQLLIFLAFFLLNKVYAWSKSRSGWFFMILTYLSISLNSVITGFYYVAMSENLYTPLIILGIALFLYFNHQVTNEKRNKTLTLLGIILLAACAYLTRTIGLALIVTNFFALLFIKKINKKNWIRNLIVAIFGLILTVLTIYLFNYWENGQIVHQEFVQEGYESLMTNYQLVVANFLSGQANYFWALKIIGNHLTYLALGTFFLPFYFLIKDFFNAIKKKQIPALTIFVISYALVAGLLSFLHCYSGFIDNQAIKYSTYFRYIDQVLILLNMYGLINLWQLIKNKKIANFKVLLALVAFSIFIIAFLPTRDFYTTLNSFAWSWLDLFLINPWLSRVIAFLLLVLACLAIKKKYFYYLFFILTISLQILSLTKISAMHRWLASGFVALVEPIRYLAKDKEIKDFYIGNDFIQKDLLGSYYFSKYMLLFYDNKFEPILTISQDELSQLQTPFVYFDRTDESLNNTLEFSEQIIINDKLRINLLLD